MIRSTRFASAAWLIVCSWAAAGCESFNAKIDELFRKPAPPEPAPAPVAPKDPILDGTIGSVTLMGDAVPVRLRGFGLVIGLGDNGGTDCPTSVREYLLDHFAREFAPKGSGQRRDISPQKLLDSRDSAVVQVSGLVAPGMPAGATFDVQVEALGSDTRSLEGGLLLPCELKMFDSNASGTGILAGRTLAKARGPIFTNPFAGGNGETGLGPRRGMVLGGGRNGEERPQKLMLEEPSYNTAKKIERRINERLGQSPAVAIARSAGEITVRTPPMYSSRPDRLADLVSHLFLDSGAGLVERRVREMTDSVGSAAGRLPNVSSIWEGVGRSVLPQIQPLYAHANPDVSFYAARAGIRLRDVSAVSVLGTIAASPSSPHRVPAIRELGDSGLTQAATRLAPLLDSDDVEVRIAAYDELLKLRHPAIQTVAIPCPLERSLPGVILDVVASRGPPLIYARRSREPRIAVFAAKLPVNLPIFYTRPDESITLNATESRGEITMFCRTRRSRVLSDRIVVPPRVDELIRAMATPPVPDDNRSFRGIGLHYSLIVQVLDDLCDNGSISARFVLEQTPLVDIFGPTVPTDRPETEDDVPAPRTEGGGRDGASSSQRSRQPLLPEGNGTDSPSPTPASPRDRPE